MFLFFAIVAIFLLAVFAPVLHRAAGDRAGTILALAPAAIFVWVLGQVMQVASGDIIVCSIPWAPTLGLALDFRLDGLSLLMLLLVSGIGALILIYASGYFAGDSRQGRLLAFLLFFMGSMLGLVSVDNLIAFFIFWELTSVASYLLIGFQNEETKARQSALQALMVTGVGGLCLLAGIILLGQVGGSYSVAALAQDRAIVQHPLYLPALLLVLAGAFTKSAQVPFHFWLPNAMAAPTPVSAYLHSATMVNAGVFLLARLNPVMGDTPQWHYGLTLVGVFTMFLGALMALPQTDLKRLLAYSTVSALGTLTLLIGLGTTESLKAAAVFLLVHSLYKGALFMVAGAVDHEAGTRDVRALSGLMRFMPITAVAAGLAALSMSGFPPLLGFIGKELLYEAKLQAPAAAQFITATGIVSNMMMVAVAFMVGIRPFVGKPSVEHGHEAPVSLWLGPVVLAAAGALLGLFPGMLGSVLIEPAMAAMKGEPSEIKLKLWHGINLVFLLSVATVLAGTMVYLLRRKIRDFASLTVPLTRIGPTRLYELFMSGLLRIATWQSELIRKAYLRNYILIVLAASLGGVLFALTRFGSVPLQNGFDQLALHELAIAGTVLFAAVLLAITNSRFTALLALGVVGYSAALFFVFYGAPDLAITQILVETLTLFLFVLIVYRLPRISRLSSTRRRIVDAVFAIAGGVVMTVLVLKAVHVEAAPSISSFFSENALSAYGRNVVNVILVDFRSLDTLGEIVVVVFAALGAAALLGFRGGGGKKGGGNE